jgi:ribosomal protein S18 acetylase RimI-like enzyme
VLTETLTYRTIRLPQDSARAITYHRDACRATFGDGEFEHHLERPGRYLKNLAARLEEFPEGHLLAFAADRCVGQLELQVPYGMSVGYVNLFYIAPALRRRGYGRLLQARAEQYFRSWEASEIELHVSPLNVAAVRFYEAVGYALSVEEGDMLLMAKRLEKTPRGRGG